MITPTILNTSTIMLDKLSLQSIFVLFTNMTFMVSFNITNTTLIFVTMNAWVTFVYFFSIKWFEKKIEQFGYCLVLWMSDEMK